MDGVKKWENFLYLFVITWWSSGNWFLTKIDYDRIFFIITLVFLILRLILYCDLLREQTIFKRDVVKSKSIFDVGYI